MALPTVRYFEAAAATDSMLLSVWMPKLQELLLDAGWEIEYADADAIGTGSAETPAWDKTPEANTDAGIAVYKMPLNDHTTQWLVRFRPGWHSATSRPHMRGMQIGTTHTGGGTLTGGSTEMVPAAANVLTETLAWQASVSEDGFAYISGTSTTHPAWGFERARSATGTVLDEAWGFNKYSSSTAGYESRHVSASVGEVSDSPPFALLTHEFGNVGSVIPSAESQDATRVMVLGPYLPGGSSFFAPPRHYVLASPEDVAENSERVINVDGGDKTYKAMTDSILVSIGIFMVAVT